MHAALNTPALRRLEPEDSEAVYNGVLPVYDPSQTYSISISKTCAGATLDMPAYVLWYRATDVYGAKSVFQVLTVTLE